MMDFTNNYNPRYTVFTRDKHTMLCILQDSLLTMLLHLHQINTKHTICSVFHNLIDVWPHLISFLKKITQNKF